MSHCSIHGKKRGTLPHMKCYFKNVILYVTVKMGATNKAPFSKYCIALSYCFIIIQQYDTIKCRVFIEEKSWHFTVTTCMVSYVALSYVYPIRWQSTICMTLTGHHNIVIYILYIFTCFSHLLISALLVMNAQIVRHR